MINSDVSFRPSPSCRFTDVGQLFPFNVNHQCDGKWQLGQGKMIFENMVITELKQVSSGSWSPVICVE